MKIYLFVIVCFCYQLSVCQTNFNLQIPENKTLISKHIYGHFAEHLGRCVYDGIYVGQKSEIPNLNGIRIDIIKALKELKIPNLRWPGGCFADYYHWKDGIGPKDERPSMVNIWWGGETEDNSFGTHDFLNLCEELETEPFISANIGTGTVKELMEWIQYTKHDGISPMSKLRRENGRESPWNVTFWGVGNETWGCGGMMTPEFYANKYRLYSSFMTNRQNNNKIYRVASGAYGENYNWTEVLLKNIPKKLIEAISLHYYTSASGVIGAGRNPSGSATNFGAEEYFNTMKSALKIEEIVKNHISIMDKYDKDQRIDLVVDEWGSWYGEQPGTKPRFLFQQNTIRDAMIAGVTLNIFNNNARRIKMANLAQTVNVLQAVILTEEEKIILTPTYHVMKLFSVHHDAELINLKFESPLYEFQSESLKALNASASMDNSGNIHVSIVNLDDRESHPVSFKLPNFEIKKIEMDILTSKNLNDHNTFKKNDLIKPKSFEDYVFVESNLDFKIPPHSVMVIKLVN